MPGKKGNKPALEENEEERRKGKKEVGASSKMGMEKDGLWKALLPKEEVEGVINEYTQLILQ